MNKNKRRGTDLEREIVNLFKAKGIQAKRAYASNGESLGHDKEVDILVTLNDDTLLKVQCKRKKKLPKYLGMTDKIDAVGFKEDRGEIYIMIRCTDFIERVI